MAKIVIAGKADCPYFSKIELLGDCLAKNLPNFKLHKILKQPCEWDSYLKQLCEDRGWTYDKSPIVWRELVDRGGKGILIGGVNDFLEYIDGYYGFQSQLTSNDMLKIADENLQTTIEVAEEEQYFKSLSNPINVCISNASSDVCYHMIYRIAKGEVFGPHTEINLNLLDSPDNLPLVEGVRLEAEDLACSLLRNVRVTSDPLVAFAACKAIVLLDEVDLVEEEEKEAFYKRNFDVFSEYGNTLARVAPKDTKVIVAGSGPVNFNVYMLLKHAPDFSPKNVVALSRLVENHVKGIIAKKCELNSANVVDVVIWGNPAGVFYADYNNVRIHNSEGAIWGPPFYSRAVGSLVHDAKWFETEFLESLSKHTVMLTDSLKRRPVMSHAAAVVSTLADWFNGSKEGQIFSLGLVSQGWYDIPEGPVCSVPVTVSANGDWTVVHDLPLNEDAKTKISSCVENLLDEIDFIYPDPTRVKKPPTPVIIATDVIPEESTEDVEAKKDSSDPNTDDSTMASSADETDQEKQPALGKIEEMEEEGGEKADETEAVEEKEVPEEGAAENDEVPAPPVEQVEE